MGCWLEACCLIFMNNPHSRLIAFKLSGANPRLAQEQSKMLRPGWTPQQTMWMLRFINWTRPLHVEALTLKTSHSRIGTLDRGQFSFFHLISVQHRFYGKNYPRLLKIKKYWDPENIINHCYSVGSTDQECCVKDNWKTKYKSFFVTIEILAKGYRVVYVLQREK